MVLLVPGTSQQERWLISACRLFIKLALLAWLSSPAALDRRRFGAGCCGASSAVFAGLSFFPRFRDGEIHGLRASL